jgi:hypothetical protein
MSFSMVPVILSDSSSLGLSRGLPPYSYQVNIYIHCTDPLNFSPVSTHTCSCPTPLFLSPTQVPPSLCLLWLFSYPFYLVLKHEHLGITSCWSSYGLWIVSFVLSIYSLIRSHQWIHTMYVLLVWVISLICQLNLFACKFHNILIFNTWLLFHCVNEPSFLYPFPFCGTFGLLYSSGYYT